MQELIFPMKVMRITQGYLKGSHKGSYAIDLAGKDTKQDRATVVADSVIVKISGHLVYTQTLGICKSVNGDEDYYTCVYMHDNNVKNLYVGQIIRQGEFFYDEGTAGNASGNHIHFSIAKGKYQGAFYNSYKRWVLKNQIKPQEALFITKDTIILDNGGLGWVMTDSLTYDPNSNYKIYTVQKGDYLRKIAKKFGVNWLNIANVNGIKAPSYIVYKGQVLKIPKF